MTQTEITRRKAEFQIQNMGGAIFDLDGALLDSMSIWQDAGVRYLASRQLKQSLDLPREDLIHMCYPGAGCGLFKRTVSASGYTSGNFKWN